MNRMATITTLLASIACLTACDAGRADGDIKISLINLQREGAVAVQVSLNEGSIGRTSQLADLAEDSVVFTGLRASDRYQAAADTVDWNGGLIQCGISPSVYVKDDGVVEVPVVLVTIDETTRCGKGESWCESLAGFEILMGCPDGTYWYPIQHCGGKGSCGNGVCGDSTFELSQSDADDVDDEEVTETPISVCDPSIPSNVFTTEVNHPYFPLPVHRRLVLEGNDEGNVLTVTIQVLAEPIEVDGVMTRVVEALEMEGEGEMTRQRTLTYYAQVADGTVCHFGEDVWRYEEGTDVYMADLSWASDYESNLYPGIAMPAGPKVGMSFQQQVAPPVALDRGEIVDMGTAVEVPLGVYLDTVWIRESSPVDEGVSLKVYASGIGLVKDESLSLTAIEDVPLNE